MIFKYYEVVLPKAKEESNYNQRCSTVFYREQHKKLYSPQGETSNETNKTNMAYGNVSQQNVSKVGGT